MALEFDNWPNDLGEFAASRSISISINQSTSGIESAFVQGFSCLFYSYFPFAAVTQYLWGGSYPVLGNILATKGMDPMLGSCSHHGSKSLAPVFVPCDCSNTP